MSATELLVPTKTFRQSADIGLARMQYKEPVSKQNRQKKEQDAATEPFPKLPQATESEDKEKTATKVAPMGKIGRLVETAQVIILDTKKENYGLPEGVNTAGMDQLKIENLHCHPSIVSIGHGSHLTLNPVLVFGWSEQHQLPINAEDWEDQFVSIHGNAPRRRDWRYVAAQTAQVYCEKYMI
ncbi:MAG: hypothetical protein GY740_16070, partial [Gammaproteobacteria bacterium]|nr:hypothetical protein [Gammaproteobacteria bacterium]